MTVRIAITGVGVLSALGDDPRAVHAALCEGRTGFVPLAPDALAPVPPGRGLPDDPSDIAGLPVALLPQFEAERYLGTETNLRPLDGTGRRLASAAALAFAASGWSEADRGREPVGLVTGTMFAGMRTIAEFDRRALEAGPQYVMPLDFANTVFNAAAGQTAIQHRLTGPNATLGGGPVAGLQALGYAADLLRSGQAKACLAGGVDELSREALRAFARGGLLCRGEDRGGRPVPFDRRRDGCALGEGAVFFLLEPVAEAERRGAPILAEVLAGASAWAPVPPERDGKVGEAGDATAAALARTIREVFERSELEVAALDAWSASANGSPARDRSEARGFVAAVGERAGAVAVAAVKGALGEALGAGGPLQALALVEAMASGRLPGIAGLEAAEADLGLDLSARERALDLRLGLVTAVGFDGAVEALLLRRWEG